MKRYKVHFSWGNLLGDTQAEVVKLQMLGKTLTASGAFTTWLGSDGNHAIYVGVGGFFVDILLSCLFFEKVYDNRDKTTM